MGVAGAETGRKITTRIFTYSYSTYYWQNAAWYNVVTDPFSLPEENQPNFIYYRHLVSFFDRFNFNELYPESKAFAPPLLTSGKDRHIFYVSENRLGLFGEFLDLTGKTVSIQWRSTEF